jgi:tagatose 6-phosphate kinase
MPGSTSAPAPRPVLTVTLNAALDVTYRVARLRPHETNRVEACAVRAGGKGVNVARVLAALGYPAVVTGFAGGTPGAELRALLRRAAGPGTAGGPAVPGADGTAGASTTAGEGAAGVAAPPATPARAAALTDALVPVAGATRRTVTVVDATGGATVFNEPGPHVTAGEWASFTAAYEGLLTGAAAVALCGSLPPGAPADAYATLARAARERGIPVLLDTSGEALRHGLAAGPDVVKPNATELAEATGLADPAEAALRLAGAAAGRPVTTAVAASLGAEGLLLVEPGGTWRARCPRALRGNPTGSGDSAVAGLLSALLDGLPWPDRLRRAAALSAATVLAPAAGEFDAAAYRELLPLVRVGPATAAVTP